MNVEFDTNVQRKLEEIAQECNLPVEQACQIILSQFAKVDGGRVYVGSEKDGSLMFVVQWPFLTGFEKKTPEELQKMAVK